MPMTEPDLDWKRAIEDPRQPLVEHLTELRRRLIVSLLLLGAGTAAAWNWSGQFLDWLVRPAAPLYFSAPGDAFYTRLKAAVFGGFLLTLPLLLHQAWLFMARALPAEARKATLRLLPAAYFLFIGGAALAVTVVVPAAMRFLLAFGSDEIRPWLALSSYLEFVTSLALAFGCAFQLPVVMVGLNRLGVVSRAGLSDKRRYVYLAAVVAAALMTPGPDVISQLALFLPTVLLFELTLLAL
jgi:sec-independent protein translocase protein TatC